MLARKKFLGLIIALTLTGCYAGPKPNTDSKINNTKLSTTTITNTKEQSDSTKASVAKEQPTAPNTETNSSTVAKPFTPLTLGSINGLATKTIYWSWLYSPRDNAALLSKYQGYALGDTSKKVIYLTFDEGYENGYTPSILDTLKANDVKVTFFVTEPFVTGSYNGVKDVELLKRMMNEGHIIGNHSVSHKSMPSFQNEAAFDYEIQHNEQTVDSIPGLKMSKFFRPPMGDFSELSLYYTQKLGYKSIFFALAHSDYDPANQPNPVTAKANLLKATKPGTICLLHAVSKTNTEILDSLIKEWKSQGYEFKTLNDL